MVGARFVMNLPEHLLVPAGTALQTLATTTVGVAPPVGILESALKGGTCLFRDGLYTEQT